MTLGPTEVKKMQYPKTCSCNELLIAYHAAAQAVIVQNLSVSVIQIRYSRPTNAFIDKHLALADKIRYINITTDIS